MLDTITNYYRYYVRAAVHFWSTMGPYEYGGVLIVIGVIGWLMMKGRTR